MFYAGMCKGVGLNPEVVLFKLCNEFKLHMECRIQPKAPLPEGEGHEDDHRAVSTAPVETV